VAFSADATVSFATPTALLMLALSLEGSLLLLFDMMRCGVDEEESCECVWKEQRGTSGPFYSPPDVNLYVIDAFGLCVRERAKTAVAAMTVSVVIC
jgi:hypothetical protein